MWRADYDPFVLRIHAEPADSADAGFDLKQLAEFSTVVVQPDGQQHIVVSDGFNHIRIDVVSGSLIDGPVRLSVVCDSLRQIKASATAMQRLASVLQYHRFIPTYFPADRRCARWIKALRTYDGLCAGASHRDIAFMLFGADTVANDWDADSDFMRSGVRRIIATAKALAQGGYLTLINDGCR